MMLYRAVATLFLLCGVVVVVAAAEEAATEEASPPSGGVPAHGPAVAHPMSSHPHPAGEQQQQQQQQQPPPHSQQRPPPQQQQRPASGSVATSASQLPPFPQGRFTKWDHLSQEARQHAHKVGYHEKDWNKPGQFPGEKKDFESLAPGQQTELAALGITAAQWDCYVNHYRNYDWPELQATHQEHYMTLGWNSNSWETEETTDIEGKYWEDLTTAQRTAATALCYTQNIWDEVAIPLWQEDDGSGTSYEKDDKANLYSAKENHVAKEKQEAYEALYDPMDRAQDTFQGPASAHNDRNIEVPLWRYDPWDLLPANTKNLAIKAGYNEKTWNAIGSHPMEKQDLETIATKHPSTAKALKAMGFSEKQWDCYMSHYLSYDWDELKQAGVQQFYQELGYSHRTWDSATDKPDTDGLYWPDLTVSQQNAAYQLGYFREVWDEVSLQFWPRTTANTASLKNYAQHHPAAVGGGVIVTISVLAGMLFACVWCSRRPRKSNNKWPRGSTLDLEMYPPGFPRGYSDDPKVDIYDDDAYTSNKRAAETKPIV